MQKWRGIFLNEKASIFYPKNTNFRILADLSIVREDVEKKSEEKKITRKKFSSLLHREVNNIIFKKEIYCVSLISR